MPIIGIVGSPGKGKTLLMTMLCHVERMKGRKVLTNFGYRHRTGNFVAKELIERANGDFNDIVLACDEIHVFLDSRESGTRKNRLVSILLTQTRKLDVDLLYTTQRWHQVDRRLRDLTDYIIECNKKVVGYTSEGKEMYLFIYKIRNLDNGKVYKFARRMDDVYDLYDTKEVITDFTAHDIKNEVEKKKKKEKEKIKMDPRITFDDDNS